MRHSLTYVKPKYDLDCFNLKIYNGVESKLYRFKSLGVLAKLKSKLPVLHLTKLTCFLILVILKQKVVKGRGSQNPILTSYF